MWLGLSLCYWLRPDGCAALTIFPVWGWSLFGLLLTAMGWHRDLLRPLRAVMALWLLLLLAFADEPRSLIRAFVPPSPGDLATNLRVVSLNCSAGDPAAAAEVADFKADIVLLQESPSRRDVQRLARELFGEEGAFVWGVDGSILARGQLAPRRLTPTQENYFVQAHLRQPDGREAEVFSLRLMTPPFRIDLWSPECWAAYRAQRELQRDQMKAIATQMDGINSKSPIILGGDFNAPQGDAVFEALHPRLRDSFVLAGRGWGNTIINDFPALRIDQIWASEALLPLNVVAHQTKNSDHRAVIADFQRRD
jgi:endonuclease/exonuclease/phosphatase (EEP) superfamily protein YafD